MRNKRNKYIALIVSLIMLFDFVPLSAFAEELVVVDVSESQTVPVMPDPEEPEEEFWEEVISKHIDDYTVTVTVTKEAEFPVGTTVTINPLDSNDYRNEAASHFDRKDNELGSFIRVFDITFWFDGMEIEPLVPVDVKVTFDNAVELEGNNELKLIHLHEDEAAKEIEAETETAETEEATGIESLSFQSDKFSTYIVAEEVVVYTFSESGNNYEVVLKCNSAMGIPQDAVFTVEEITKDSDLYDQYAAQVAAVINPEGGVRMPALLDISLKTADGEKIQLDNKVQVIVRLTDENVQRGLQVVHFPGEDPFQGESAVRDAVANSDINKEEIEILDIESERLYARLNTKENTVTFNTDSFSVFALAYTVEFTYEDLNGNLHIDFTGYDVLDAADESAIVYNTAECDIHVSADWLSSLLQKTAEPEEGVAVTAENSKNFRFDFTSAETEESTEGVRYSEGDLTIASDGSVCLTDGKRSLTITITNLSVLKEEILEADGVSIEILDGKVPLGSEASYEMHTEEDTQKLVDLIRESEGKAEQIEEQPEEWLEGQLEEQPAEQPEEKIEEQPEESPEEQHDNSVGYAAADLRIIRNGEDVNASGLFKVTVEKSRLVPEGMILKQLYHIHDGEVEPLEVEETETGIVFEVADFSDIVAFYTVEFHNGDKEVIISGGSKILLSTLLTKLELVHRNGTAIIVDDVEKVEFSTPALFHVLEVFKDEEVILNKNTEQAETVTIETEHDFVITSLLPFTEDEMILTMTDGTIIRIKVTDQIIDTLTTTIKFFAKDAQIYQDNEDPAHSDWPMHIVGMQEAPELQKLYYLRAVLKDSLGHDLGWAVQAVELNGHENTQVSFNEFHPFEIKSNDETEAQYEARRGQDITSGMLAYNAGAGNTIETRLFRTDHALTDITYHGLYLAKTDGKNAADVPEDGYEFGGNFYPADKQNEIDIKKSNNKRYKVRVILDSAADDCISQDEDFYIFVRINHATGEPSYQYDHLVITADDIAKGYKDYDFSQYLTPNGNPKTPQNGNNAFTGNESSIEVYILKFSGEFKPNNFTNATVNTEGSAIKAYKVNYDTGANNPQSSTSGYHEEYETIDGKDITNCIDYINLTTIDAEGQYNYASILGPNLIYGIVADHLYHENHLQTNFAVNHYTGHGVDARPDLSGSTSGGAIVIAQYNYQATDYVQGEVINGIGAPVYEQDIAGQLFIGQNLNGTLVAYVDKDTGSPSNIETTNEGKIRGNKEQTAVIQTSGAELSANIVNPALQYGVNMSNELASKPVTFDPPIPSQGKLTLDTTAFDDDATIFINASRIKDFIGNAGQLIIKKHDNQTIIFNFNELVGRNEEITLAQFMVYQESIPNGFSTYSPEGKGSTDNQYMDAIARHIVWNLNNVKGKTTIKTSGGIMLQPNVDSEISVEATTAGWIVSKGLVYNGSGEWHNVFSQMPDTNKLKLYAYKTVDGKAPRLSHKFEFFLDEWIEENGTWDWHPLQTKRNNTGSIEFDQIDNLAAGWHIYRIHENQTKPAGTRGYYVMDGQTYYAAVRVQVLTVGGQPKTIVSIPAYYKEFNPAEFNPEAIAATGVSGSKVSMVVFNNEEVKEGLTILKQVEGTTDNTKDFTFEIELWRLINNSATETANLQDATTYKVITSTGEQTLAITNDADGKKSRGTITLKAGEMVTIQGLPSGTFYKITETKVGNKTISMTEYVDGYKGKTAPQTGSMETNDAVVSVTFNNEYKSQGTLLLEATKVLTDANGAPRTLVADQFGFDLVGLNAPATAYNDANGHVTFETIIYTQADMSDAELDPVTGVRTKTITYTVHEKQGTATENGFTYKNVVYDEDKTITVTLVDNGNGIITATPVPADLSIEFNNVYEKKVRTYFIGQKQLVGRKLNSSEFRFNAALTKYVDSGSVEHVYADDVAREAVDFVSATKVTGTNLAASVDGEKIATGLILFPSITFKQAGTYFYTVNEDTGYMAEDVQEHEAGQSYDVRITVTETPDPDATGETILTATVSYPNGNTIINDRKKMSFTVTKQWYDLADQEVFEGHSITMSLIRDGVAFPVTDGKVEKIGDSATDGNFIVNGDGTVTLTAGTTAWPVIRFKDLEYPDTDAGYVVMETGHSGKAEEATLITKFNLTVSGSTSGDVASCPAINKIGSSLIIKNKEEDHSTGLQVTKKFVLPNGSDGNTIAGTDPIYFAVELDLNGSGWWTDYNNGSAITVDSTHKAIYQITWNTSSNEWNTVDVGEIPEEIVMSGYAANVLGYRVVETTETGLNKTTGANLIDIKYYKNYGKLNESEITTTLPTGSGASVTIENTIPAVGSIEVDKVWVDNNTSRPESIYVCLRRKLENESDESFNFAIDNSVDKSKTELKNANSWHCEWHNLALTNESGVKWVYKVTEYPGDNVYYSDDNIPGYSVAYAVTNGHTRETIEPGDLVTITNIKNTTGIAVRKVWNVNNNNDIKPISVELRKAQETPEENAVKVKIYAYRIEWDGKEVDGEAFESYVKYGSDITVSLEKIQEIRKDSGNPSVSYTENSCKITNITSDFVIGIKTEWNVPFPTVNCVAGMIPDYTNYSIVGRITLSEDGVARNEGTTDGGANWYYEWTGLDDGYYFVEETTTGYDVTYSPNNNGIKTGTITITNSIPQNASVQVTKSFVFPAGSGLTVPTDFQITAKWGDPEQTITLKVNEQGYINDLPTGIAVTKTDNGDNSYTWTISNLSLLTEVTFEESGYRHNGYNVVATYSPGNGKANAAVTPEAVTITNEYTAGVELPATGGPGTALYTFLGLMILLLAGGLLVFNKRRGARENK